MDDLFESSTVEFLLDSDSAAVKNVILKVGRANFCASFPYEDEPQSIWFGQTISALHMHAYALSLVYQYAPRTSRDGFRILDVGSGSGYLTVVLAYLFPTAYCPIIGVNVVLN